MKKILTILTFIICSVICRAQYPLTQNLGSGSTLVQVPADGALRAGLIPRVYTDTVAANLTNLKYYDGSIVKTTTPIEALWWRDLSALQWIQLLPSGGSTGLGAWLTTLNSVLPTDINNDGSFGTSVNAGIKFITNTTTRFILPKGGLAAHTADVQPVGINSVTGNLSFYTPSSGITTASNGLTVTGSNVTLGGTLTGATTIAGGGNDFTFNGLGTYIIANSQGSEFKLETDFTRMVGAHTSGRISQISVSGDDITITPTLGTLIIDTLNNSSFQNTLIGWTTTSGANRGKVGYLTLSGLSIASGVLTNSFTGTVTSVGFTGGIISVANPTTTPAFTVAGTSGGIPYFSSTSTWASSALLAANSIMIGGGAATAPLTATASAQFATIGGGATAAQLRFLEGSAGGTNYAGFQSPATLAGNNIYTFPTAFPAGTYLLNSTSAGVLGFTDPSTFLTGLTNGSGTTASGTAVNLGGTATGNISIDMTSSDFSLINSVGEIIKSTSADQTVQLGVTGTNANIILDEDGKTFVSVADNGYTLNGGTVTVANLAGAGTRAVLADASGVLSAPVSDRTVKQNIHSLTSGLSVITKLKPVSFEYINGWKNYGQGTQIGFIAQDIAKVLPNSVFTTPSTGKMGYNSSDLIPVMVSALQSQQRQIDELKSEIKNLKRK